MLHSTLNDLISEHEGEIFHHNCYRVQPAGINSVVLLLVRLPAVHVLLVGCSGLLACAWWSGSLLAGQYFPEALIFLRNRTVGAGSVYYALNINRRPSTVSGIDVVLLCVVISAFYVVTVFVDLILFRCLILVSIV